MMPGVGAQQQPLPAENAALATTISTPALIAELGYSALNPPPLAVAITWIGEMAQELLGVDAGNLISAVDPNWQNVFPGMVGAILTGCAVTDIRARLNIISAAPTGTTAQHTKLALAHYLPAIWGDNRFLAAQALINAGIAVLADPILMSVVSPAPLVVVEIPGAGALNVAVGSTVLATFSSQMDPSTFTPATFAVKDPFNVQVTGTISLDTTGKVATFTPTAHLAYNQTYTVTISSGNGGVKDIGGNAMALDATWSFTTGVAPGPPTVVGFTPPNGTAGYPITWQVDALFNAPVDPTTLTSLTVLLIDSLGAHVQGAITYSGDLSHYVALQPNSPLSYSSAYSIVIKGGNSGVKAPGGAPMVADATASFTTTGPPAPLHVTSTSPVDGSVNTSTTGAYSVVFDAPIAPATASSTTCYFADTSNVTLGTGATSVIVNGNTVTCTPNVALTAGTTYHLVITTGVFSNSGGALATNFILRFTTAAIGGGNPPPAPTVIANTPAIGGTNTAINTTVTATFSEVMDPTTVTATTFTLTYSGGTVAATVVMDNTTHIATLTPTATLVPSTTYTAKVKGGALGVRAATDGQTMVADYTWSFITGAAPTVVSTAPSAGSVNVAANTTVAATFSIAMDPASITSSTFFLKTSLGATIAGSIAMSAGNTVATFTPTSVLPAAGTYTATVKGGSSGVRGADQALLAADYVWNFTVQTAPTVVTVSPANGAVGVSPTATIIVNFSESMDPATITGANFNAHVGGSGSLAGTIAMSNGNSTATLTPSSNLVPGVYTVTVNGGGGGVASTGGTVMASTYTWTFTV